MSIWFNGKSSDDLHVVVEYFPDFPIPQRKYERTSVAGRNGDIISMQPAFENITKVYKVYINAMKERLPAVAHSVAEWLLQTDYCRLEDTYEQDYYRMAFFTGGNSIENILNRMGRAELEFTCRPQKWLKSGEYFITPVNGQKLINPTPFTAAPVIKTAGNGSITIGGKTLTIAGTTGTVTLDCENENAYQNSANLNNKVSGEFPTITGAETISWTGLSAVSVQPNWWTV